MAKAAHHPAGKRQTRITFEKREAVDDGYGNTVSGDFVGLFDQYAEIAFLRGGETVIASRLESRQPAIISVLADDERLATVTADWRVRVVEDGQLFNIRTITRTPNRAYYEMLCETGVNPG